MLLRTNEKLGLSVNTYQIKKEDILDCNGDMLEDFEDSLDDHEKLIEIVKSFRCLIMDL